MVFARYTIVSAFCSCGGLLLGMDTSITGPVTIMDSFTSTFEKPSSSIHGIIVFCILLSAACSSFFAGWLADAIERTRALALEAGIFTLGATIQAGAVKSLAMFATGRMIEGIGYGIFLGTQTVYICEISLPRKRGSLTAGPQLTTCLALVIGYLISYGSVNSPGSLSRRLPYIILASAGLAYTLTCLFLLTESPRWLILRDRLEEAKQAWDSLGVKHEDREITFTQPTSNATFTSVFNKDVRKRTLIAVFLMGFL